MSSFHVRTTDPAAVADALEAIHEGTEYTVTREQTPMLRYPTGDPLCIVETVPVGNAPRDECTSDLQAYTWLPDAAAVRAAFDRAVAHGCEVVCPPPGEAVGSPLCFQVRLVAGQGGTEFGCVDSSALLAGGGEPVDPGPGGPPQG